MAKIVKPALPVTRIEGTRFRVGSESVPAKAYEVDLADTGYSCTCEAGQHGRLCKHVKAALAKNEAEQVDESKELDGGKARPRRSSRLDKLGYEFGEVASRGWLREFHAYVYSTGPRGGAGVTNHLGGRQDRSVYTSPSGRPSPRPAA